MGYALATAARDLGASTTLITGPTSLTLPDGVTVIQVETTDEMFRAVKSRFQRADCLIMAAAPADYTPAEVTRQKIKKDSRPRTLILKSTIDILKNLGSRKKPGQVLVGFALETENGVVNARKKLKDKNLDLVILNNPRDEYSAFDYDTNRITLIAPRKKPEAWPLMTKRDIAVKLLEKITRLM